MIVCTIHRFLQFSPGEGFLRAQMIFPAYVALDDAGMNVSRRISDRNVPILPTAFLEVFMDLGHIPVSWHCDDTHRVGTETIGIHIIRPNAAMGNHGRIPTTLTFIPEAWLYSPSLW